MHGRASVWGNETCFSLVTIYNRAPYHSTDRKRNVWNLLVCVYTHPQPLGKKSDNS